MKLTEQDAKILAALKPFRGGVSSYRVGIEAKIRTSSIGETTARHLIKLTKLGLAAQTGTRMFPTWEITDAGRAALSHEGE